MANRQHRLYVDFREKKEEVYVASLIKEVTLHTYKSQIKHVLKTVDVFFLFKVRLFQYFLGPQNSFSSNLKESHGKVGGRYESKSFTAKTDIYIYISQDLEYFMSQLLAKPLESYFRQSQIKEKLKNDPVD